MDGCKTEGEHTHGKENRKSSRGYGSSGVDRTQPMLGHSMGTLCLLEFQHKTKKLGGSGGMLPQKSKLPRSVLGYFRPYRRVESGALPLCGICTRCEVTSLLTANSHAVRLGERTRLRYNN